MVLYRRVPTILQRGKLNHSKDENYHNVLHDKKNYNYLNKKTFSIDIVYFANLFVNMKYGQQLIIEQLKDLITTELTHISNVHIVLSVPTEFDFPSFKLYLEKLFVNQCQKVFFHIVHENCHEYPGIELIYCIANNDSSASHYLLYFHSKGMTRFHGHRERVEIALHKTVIAKWPSILNIFETHPNIDKIGSTSSQSGWIWWNYWWVRASYIINVEKPIKTSRRHYYEDWLCRILINPQENVENEKCLQSNVYRFNCSNCWSLSFVNPMEACDPHTALRALLQSLI